MYEVDVCQLYCQQITWMHEHMNSSFVADSMLSLTNKAVFIKLFYMNDESATEALQKFRLGLPSYRRELKTEKGPISTQGILKLVRHSPVIFSVLYFIASFICIYQHPIWAKRYRQHFLL